MGITNDHTHKKMGRPIIGKLKCYDIKVRVDEDMHGSLLKYCEEHNTKKAEFIREAIKEKLEREHQEKAQKK